MLWAATPHFLTVSNLLNVLEQTAINAIVAVGMTFVIISGGIDLSVGSVLALSGIAPGEARSRPALPAPVAIALALAVGLGVRPGQRPARSPFGRLPPFIATLGMMSVARGAALMLAEGRPISGFGDGFRALATERVLMVPAPVLITGRHLCSSPTSCSRGPCSDARRTRSAATRKRRGCPACTSGFTRPLIYGVAGV